MIPSTISSPFTSPTESPTGSETESYSYWRELGNDWIILSYFIGACIALGVFVFSIVLHCQDVTDARYWLIIDTLFYISSVAPIILTQGTVTKWYVGIRYVASLTSLIIGMVYMESTVFFNPAVTKCLNYWLLTIGWGWLLVRGSLFFSTDLASLLR